MTSDVKINHDDCYEDKERELTDELQKWEKIINHKLKN